MPPGYQGEKVVYVVGDAMLDVAVEIGNPPKTQEDHSVPVFKLPPLTAPNVKTYLGGAGNVAANLTALGEKVFLFGCDADDDAGTELTQLTDAAGIEDMGVRVAPEETYRTTIKTRFYADGRLAARVDADGHFDPSYPPTDYDADRYPPSAVVLSDYGKGVLTADSAKRWVEFARRYGVTVYADPYASNLDAVRTARPDVLVLNALEANVACELGGNQASDLGTDSLAENYARTVHEKFGVRLATIVKRGKYGSTVFRPHRDAIHVPPVKPQDVFDRQGAGDTYLAALVSAHLNGCDDLEDAALFASAAAGVAVGKPGTAAVTRNEAVEALKPLVARRVPGPCTVTYAAFAAKRMRSLGLRVGYTSGCFDLAPTAGHLAVVKAAAESCDFLFVGLDSDARVRRLKGPTRPVVLQDARAEVIGALAGVGCAFVFDTDNAEVLKALKPHVWIKGGDYTLATLPEVKELAAWGGDLKIVEKVAGESTTDRVGRLSTTTTVE